MFQDKCFINLAEKTLSIYGRGCKNKIKNSIIYFVVLNNFCKEMILNGKVKEEFFNWLDNQGVNGIDISNWEFEKFHLLSNVSQNSLIIEWFDSVGIYITSDYFELNKGFYSEILDSNFAIVKPTRQEALTEAIKKANEIYN